MTSKITIEPEILYQALDDEAMLLHLPTERYFGLNGVGQRVWQLIEAGLGIDVIKQQLSSEYEVAPEILHRDIDTLLAQLAARGLIKVHS